jgi:peptidyl-dipeptidase Dcp
MALSPANPFFSASALPYQAPPFDRLHDADYQPAIEAGMHDQIAEIDSIANATSDPTFENTIVPMERSGALLTRASKVFFALASANTNDTIQKIQSELAPKLAAHSDAIFLNDKLYRRVHAIYQKRDASNLSAEQRRLVEHYERDFVRAGVRLAEADKARVRALNQEEGKLTTDFQTKLLAATKAGAVVVSDSTQLAGLTAADLAAAAAAAKERGLRHP